MCKYHWFELTFSVLAAHYIMYCLYVKSVENMAIGLSMQIVLHCCITMHPTAEKELHTDRKDSRRLRNVQQKRTHGKIFHFCSTLNVCLPQWAVSISAQ